MESGLCRVSLCGDDRIADYVSINREDGVSVFRHSMRLSVHPSKIYDEPRVDMALFQRLESVVTGLYGIFSAHLHVDLPSLDEVWYYRIMSQKDRELSLTLTRSSQDGSYEDPTLVIALKADGIVRMSSGDDIYLGGLAFVKLQKQIEVVWNAASALLRGG